nr:MAG TPA: hypothetical protein [Caudoviricetes sp.]DAX51819.1 MAG TPA: hypothetical protein [Caudoviricetes sp.]
MTCCPMADTTHVLAHTVVQIKLKNQRIIKKLP